jgi:hypothetical protein
VEEETITIELDTVEQELDQEVFVEIETAVQDIQVRVETYETTVVAEEAVTLANAGGSTEADAIKIQFDTDAATVESTTVILIQFEKAETEAIEMENTLIIEEELAE